MDWQNAIRAGKLREGKSKVVTVGSKILMKVNQEVVFHAADGRSKRKKWPLSWGGKIENGCVRCPLHQTTHCISDGSLVEWAPFPLFPPYGRLVGSMVSKKDLGIFETRVESGYVQVLI